MVPHAPQIIGGREICKGWPLQGDPLFAVPRRLDEEDLRVAADCLSQPIHHPVDCHRRALPVSDTCPGTLAAGKADSGSHGQEFHQGALGFQYRALPQKLEDARQIHACRTGLAAQGLSQAFTSQHRARAAGMPHDMADTAAVLYTGFILAAAGAGNPLAQKALHRLAGGQQPHPAILLQGFRQGFGLLAQQG